MTHTNLPGHVANNIIIIGNKVIESPAQPDQPVQQTQQVQIVQQAQQAPQDQAVQQTQQIQQAQQPRQIQLVQPFTHWESHVRKFDTSVALGIVGALLLYFLFSCWCVKRICDKCDVKSLILVWIPVLNIIPLIRAAKLPLLTMLLLLIPIVNAVFLLVVWARICQERGKSGWLVILLFIPGANLCFIPYLAFSE